MIELFVPLIFQDLVIFLDAVPGPTQSSGRPYPRIADDTDAESLTFPDLVIFLDAVPEPTQSSGRPYPRIADDTDAESDLFAILPLFEEYITVLIDYGDDSMVVCKCRTLSREVTSPCSLRYNRDKTVRQMWTMDQLSPVLRENNVILIYVTFFLKEEKDRSDVLEINCSQNTYNSETTTHRTIKLLPS